MKWTQSDTDALTFIIGVILLITGGGLLWGWQAAILITGLPLTICPWIKHMVKGGA